MNPIKSIPSVHHDLDDDLTTLARVFRMPNLSNRDRLRIAGHVVACIRIRRQLGTYGMSPRERDTDFMHNLALPTPN